MEQAGTSWNKNMCCLVPVGDAVRQSDNAEKGSEGSEGSKGSEGGGGGFAAGCVEGLRRFAQGATALRAEGERPSGDKFYKPPAAVTSA